MAQTIIVDISTRGANPVAYTHQGDTGRTFFAEIYENGEAFAVAGYTIKVGAILPADRGYYVIAGNDMVTATKTTDGTNKIYFTLSDKYSLKAGNGILTLIFTSNTGTPSTIRPINIDLRIQKSADADDTIAGASDFPEGLESIAESVFQEYLSTYLPPVAPSSSAAANKAADAKLTGEALDDLKSDLSEQTYNLVSGKLVGLTVDGSGGMQNWGGTTDMVYAPVSNGKTYTIKTDDSSGFVGAFYESKPTAETTASYNNSRVVQASKTFTAPITGYVAFRTSTGYAEAQIVEGNVDKPYIRPLTAVDIVARESVNDLMTPVYEYVSIDNISITDRYFMNSSGGNTGPYDDWEYGKISVSEGEIYKITTKTGSYALPWLLLNGSSVISYSSYPSGQPVAYVTETITIPQNAQYLVVNSRKDGNITIQRLEQTGTGIDGRKVYLNDKSLSSLIKGEDVLSGKVLCCCGDSITYGADMDADGITQESNITVFQSDNSGNFSETTSDFLKTWNWIIANRNNMTLYNAGVSGSTMQGLSDKNGFSLANGRYTKLPDNIDYLVIWFGWNDTAYGTLGTINDSTNASYYGGYNVVLPYLINKYPYTKIALIVPFGTDANHRNAIRQLGDKWGVAVWDNYQGGTPLYYGKEDSVGVEQSVITSNRAKFQANGAHPNYRGHKQLADMIEEFLRGI